MEDLYYFYSVGCATLFHGESPPLPGIELCADGKERDVEHAEIVSK